MSRDAADAARADGRALQRACVRLLVVVLLLLFVAGVPGPGPETPATTAAPPVSAPDTTGPAPACPAACAALDADAEDHAACKLPR